MRDVVKRLLRASPFVWLFILLKSVLVRPRAQNDEEIIIDRLVARYRVPQTFIEFGFSGWEFNCAALAPKWAGLLVDGDPYNVQIARIIWGSNITAKKSWITLESLSEIKEWVAQRDLGILSVDVDGNDYWFLRELISLKPAFIIAEYNSSFGLRPVTVPYDAEFSRIKKHPSHIYYGASLTALSHLTSRYGYSLVEVGNTGVNAFFVRNDLITHEDLILQPETSFREKPFRDGSRPSSQWELIKNMPFVNVVEMDAWNAIK